MKYPNEINLIYLHGLQRDNHGEKRAKRESPQNENLQQEIQHQCCKNMWNGQLVWFSIEDKAHHKDKEAQYLHMEAKNNEKANPYMYGALIKQKLNGHSIDLKKNKNKNSAHKKWWLQQVSWNFLI